MYVFEVPAIIHVFMEHKKMGHYNAINSHVHNLSMAGACQIM